MDTTVAGLPIGHLLDGRYRVDARIARGGMATVYLGTDTRLERAVALKIAHAEFASDDGFVRRFIDEAKSVARLSSPNVVAVYDQGADGAILFLAMEYVPGQTLRQLLDVARPAAPARGAGHHRGRADRAGRGARVRHHPPRRQAGERAASPRRARSRWPTSGWPGRPRGRATPRTG